MPGAGGRGARNGGKGETGGKHDDYRPYVCVFFEREGGE